MGILKSGLAIATLMVASVTLQISCADARYQPETVVDGMKVPWSMVWLPDGDMLVAERRGEIIRFRDGKMVARLTGVPDVHENGQGGLLDLALHPEFASNQLLYLSYSDKSGSGAGSNTAIARTRMVGNALTDLEVLYKAAPNARIGRHYGSRIAFDNAGYLYFSVGDRGARDINPQDVSRDGGKIYRLHDDGRIPSDNPFADQADRGAITAVYSLGHRNVQGMARHPVSGKIWTHEHGPRGGDEVNIINSGANYGWPILSYGINYNGSSFAEGTEREGYEPPAWYWDPSIAPSGMAFVTSNKYPDWQGHLLVGSLKFGQLVLCRLEGNEIVGAETALDDLGRVRDVRQGPDGFIYVAIDGVGVQRIQPGQ
jgi:glucose/arabinose dehydrogenase